LVKESHFYLRSLSRDYNAHFDLQKLHVMRDKKTIESVHTVVRLPHVASFNPDPAQWHFLLSLPASFAES
jgi:hypothetical protein